MRVGDSFFGNSQCSLFLAGINSGYFYPKNFLHWSTNSNLIIPITLLSRLFFGFLLMISSNWVCSQTEKNVVDSNLTFDEVYKKFLDQTYVVLQKKGTEAYLMELERCGSILAKNYPQEIKSYRMFFIAAANTKDSNQRDKIYQKLSNLVTNDAPTVIAKAVKAEITLNTARYNPNKVVKQKLFERLATMDDFGNQPLNELISLAKAELNKIKFERDGIGEPLELVFEALDGRTVDLSKMKGKVVLIDFWATWCGPCIVEIPKIKKIYNKYKSEGLEVFGISLDTDRKKLETFVSENNIPWPQFFDGKGWHNRLAKKYGIVSIPTYWLVDKQGNLVDMKARKNKNLEEKVKKYLDQ